MPRRPASPRLNPLVRNLLNSLPTEGANDAEPAPTPALEALVNHKRSKLWELPEKFHCPVVGTCLPLEELKKLARRFNFSAAICDEFALHGEAVGYAHSRNAVSEALHRLLDRRYERDLARFAGLKEDGALLAAWKQCLNRGEVAGPFWAIVTHKASSPATRQTLFGDVHMLSHQVGAGQAADSRRLAFLENENQTLRREVAALQKQALAAQEDATRLKHRWQTLESEAQALHRLHDDTQRRLASFESGQVIIELGRKLLALEEANAQLLPAAQRMWDLDKQVKAAHAAAQELAEERDQALNERDALERLLQAMADEGERSACGGNPEEGPDCAACPAALAERCVLYVGGRASMLAQYRQLASRLGITLVHHDGGLEESLSRLPELIQGADVVLCPTDQISHNAYYQVKSQCKRVGKPCLFYKGGGLSSFAVAMARVGRGEVSLGRV